jgi:HTH-type transcriptional regulator/antitoxin HigA
MNAHPSPPLKYTVIKTVAQYNKYCDLHEELVFDSEDKFGDEIDLLYLLIDTWDKQNYYFKDTDPVQLLKGLMTQNHLNAKGLSEILRLSKGTVSKILNYKKAMSKETIRTISSHFKVQQEAFNRSYKLSKYI